MAPPATCATGSLIDATSGTRHFCHNCKRAKNTNSEPHCGKDWLTLRRDHKGLRLWLRSGRHTLRRSEQQVDWSSFVCLWRAGLVLPVCWL